MYVGFDESGFISVDKKLTSVGLSDFFFYLRESSVKENAWIRGINFALLLFYFLVPIPNLFSYEFNLK